MQADSIKIESDEAGFELHVETDEGDRFAFNIHSCAEALHEQVNLIIGGWLAEGQAAASMPASAIFRCAPEDIDESGGRLTDGGYENPRAYDRPGSAYELSDPKHPDFHSVHADHYDNDNRSDK